MAGHDPHQRPPDSIREVYKKYQKITLKTLGVDDGIIDPDAISCDEHFSVVEYVDPVTLNRALNAFEGEEKIKEYFSEPVPVYEHEELEGLRVIPGLLPPEIQVLLLSRLLHRDLSAPQHLTNIHTHYNVSYPPSQASLFSTHPSSRDPVAHPLDPNIHKPLAIGQLLNKKLRWMTLGGQYDWTRKIYPESSPPPFPPDIGALLEGIWPDTKAEAAIVNLYSPGDTLSCHRDVAEESQRGLISISLGCDAIFVIGTDDSSSSTSDVDGEGKREKIVTLRLRSGSAVYMSGQSRFAWHGVPQIVAGTCPEYLGDWPAGKTHDGYEEWRGWMKNKRVNLNARQMCE